LELRCTMRHVTPRFGLAALLLGLFLAATAEERKPDLARDNASSEARLLADIKFLSSDECEGRGVLTEGINKAADHIANEFKKAGLKPGGVEGTYFQPFEIRGNQPKLNEGNEVVVKGPNGESLQLQLGKDFAVVAMGGSGTVEAPVVFVGYGLTADKYNDYADVDVKGKVVVILRKAPGHDQKEEGEPRFTDRERQRLGILRTKAATAKEKGAVGILFVNDNVEAAQTQDRLLPFAYSARDASLNGVPSVHVHRTLINQMLAGTGTDLNTVEKGIDESYKPKSMELKGWTCKIVTKIETQPIKVKNVIGIVEGSGPLAEEAIVIGAHYDHLGYGEPGSLAFGSRDIHHGADDNGSGSTSVIELARRFGAKKDYKGRKLIFMTYSGEERGLLGSVHYCRHPLYPLEKTAAMVNLDMVGRLREKKLQLMGISTAEVFEKIVNEANEKVQLKIDAPKQAGSLFGASDHYSFFQKNIPVLFLFTGMHPQYHTPKDTWDTINVEGMRECCDLAEGIIDRLAVLEEKPKFIPQERSSGGGRQRTTGNVPRIGVMFSYGDDKEGALIESVNSGGIADKAGFKANDRIVEIGGQPVKSLEGYMTVMAKQKKGETVEFIVLRDGKRITLKVPLQ
jgi:Zn-dependent M28 family amino/carboxypeptidase